MAWVTLLDMSQQLASLTADSGTRAFAVVSNFAANFAANWRNSMVEAAPKATHSTNSKKKHFAFAATYAAYAKRGSWSSIG